MNAKYELKFSDTDFKLTKLIAAAVTVLTALIAILGPILSWATGEPLKANIDGTADGVVPGANPGVTITHGPVLVAEFADASPGLWLASIAPSVLFVILMGIVVWLLWALLEDVRTGQPFTMANVRRMRGIALVIIVGAALMFLVQGFVNAYLAQSALADTTLLFFYDSSLTDLLLPGMGFLIAALAEGFRRGVELEGEVEGLI